LSANSTALRSDAPAATQALTVDLPRRPWVLVVALAVLVAGSVAWVGNSPVFRMRELRVAGASHLSEADVARLAGLTSKTNVLWVSGSAVEQRLEANPWIASARVTRHLPGEIDIVLHERTAVARVPQQGGRFLLVSGDGVVLGVRTAAGAGVPVLQSAHPALSAAPSADTIAGLKAALVSVAALPPTVRAQVASATERQDGTVTLTLERGTVVEFGDAGRAAEKGRVLRALLEWSAAHGVTPHAIDVETPTAPAITPA
jgi:cell division protein FtsQ